MGKGTNDGNTGGGDMSMDVYLPVCLFQVGFPKEDAGGQEFYAGGMDCVEEAEEGKPEDTRDERQNVCTFVDTGGQLSTGLGRLGSREVVSETLLILNATVGLGFELVHDGNGVYLRAF